MHSSPLGSPHFITPEPLSGYDGLTRASNINPLSDVTAVTSVSSANFASSHASLLGFHHTIEFIGFGEIAKTDNYKSW